MYLFRLSCRRTCTLLLLDRPLLRHAASHYFNPDCSASVRSLRALSLATNTPKIEQGFHHHSAFRPPEAFNWFLSLASRHVLPIICLRYHSVSASSTTATTVTFSKAPPPLPHSRRTLSPRSRPGRPLPVTKQGTAAGARSWGPSV